eukprot:TRINITY_DN4041_c0_g1_i1.p1 TRINITY_DN4041_c0_g1~~TRINITY_DN4041_c0_g1_i1.p1  ORF type:complete len:210 (+),score=35.04 TRINITY_DN4041_c0_g1_i1:91-720(+)
MACGLGLSAARALSRNLPDALLAGSLSTTCSERPNLYAVPDEDDVPELVAIKPEYKRSTTTCESLTMDVRLRKCVNHSDSDSDSDSDSEGYSSEEASADESSEPEVRTRTVTLRDIPDPSQFMNPEWVNAHTKLFLEADEAKSFDVEFNSSDADSSSDEDEFPENAESDCEEMYSGPLQPKRTTARKDFPSPSDYLTKEELSLALEFYD